MVAIILFSFPVQITIETMFVILIISVQDKGCVNKGQTLSVWTSMSSDLITVA